MENFTRESIFDLVLVYGYTLGTFLLVSSILVIRNKVRDPGIALIRFLGGLAIIVGLLVSYSTETFSIFPIKDLTESWSLLTIIGTVIVAVGISEFAIYRVANVIDMVLVMISRRIVQNRFVSRFITYTGTVAVVAVYVALGVTVLPEVRLETVGTPPPQLRQALDFEVTLDATYSLPGSPMALVFRGETDGYITLGQGQIIHFTLPEEPNGELRSRIVTSGLDAPRGLAILDDVLYVTDLGPLPCPRIYCKGIDLPGYGYYEGAAKILRESNGSILAFDVLADGSLNNKRAIVTGLPTANFAHGANGITVGPDGLLYVSIGGVEGLYDRPDIVDAIEGPKLDFLGTVIRLKPDGSGLEIFAKGLRNVYALTFDDHGLLWGVDNDGKTMGGWHREEVLQIKRGSNYGYPFEGTFGPHKIRNDNPVWVMDGSGSAGIEWAGKFGLGPGLIVGMCTNLRYLPLVDYDNGRFLEDRNDSTLMATIPGCVTIIEPAPEQMMLIGVFNTDQLHSFKLIVHPQQ